MSLIADIKEGCPAGIVKSTPSIQAKNRDGDTSPMEQVKMLAVPPPNPQNVNADIFRGDKADVDVGDYLQCLETKHLAATKLLIPNKRSTKRKADDLEHTFLQVGDVAVFAMNNGDTKAVVKTEFATSDNTCGARKIVRARA
jgi:hypothetical protein